MMVSISLYLLFFDDLIITDTNSVVKHFLLKKIIYFGARAELYIIYSLKTGEGVGGTPLASPRLARRERKEINWEGYQLRVPPRDRQCY